MSGKRLVLGLVGLISALAINSKADTIHREYSPQTGKLEITEIPNPEALKKSTDQRILGQQIIAIGNYLEELLKANEQCDKAQFYLYEHSVKDENGQKVLDENQRSKVASVDLLIGCYEGEPGNYRQKWRINLDTMCRAVLRTDTFWKTPIRLKDILQIEDMNGNALSTNDNLKNKVADTLAAVFGMYLQNNITSCQDYRDFVKSQLGAGNDGIRR